MGKKKKNKAVFPEGVDIENIEDALAMLDAIEEEDGGNRTIITPPVTPPPEIPLVIPVSSKKNFGVDQVIAKTMAQSVMETPPIDVHPQPAARYSAPVQQNGIAKYPGLFAASIPHVYGTNGKGIQIGHASCTNGIDGFLSFPLCEVGEGLPGAFEGRESCLTDDVWEQILIDLAVISALKFQPDAVYPYNPEGVNALKKVIDNCILDDVIMTIDQSTISCYYLHPKFVKSGFIDPINRCIANAGFEVDRLRLIHDMTYDVMDGEFRGVSLVYDETRCGLSNTAFMQRVMKYSKSTDETDITPTDVINDPSKLIYSLITDIFMALSPSLDSVADEPEDDEDAEEDNTWVEPYTNEESTEAEELEGGASNDDEPFPVSASSTGTTTDEESSTTGNESGGNSDEKTFSATAKGLRSDSAADAEQRGYKSGNCTTNIGEILKSSGIVTDNAGTGNSGTSGTASEEVKASSEVPVLGRGNDAGQQQVKEEVKKEESKEEKGGSMVISVTTV